MNTASATRKPLPSTRELPNGRIKLGNSELGNVLNGVNYQNAACLYFIVSVESEEMIDMHDIENGLEKLQQFHAMLRSSLVFENNSYALVENHPKIRTFHHCRENETTAKRLWHDLVDREKLEVNTGEIGMKVFLFQKENVKNKEIALLIPHYFCDGTG